MNNTWVLVANASEARLFSLVKSDLTLIEKYTHPESRMKGEALASDRGGSYQSDSAGTGHGSYQQPTDPKEYEMDRFAQELAGALNKGRTENQFEELVIVAAPRFHGLVNKHLNGQLSQMVAHHIDKDYTKVRDLEMLDTLMPYLRPHMAS